MVSNPGDTTASIDIPNTIGNAQEYKENELVCGRHEHVSHNISNEAAILKLTQPYLLCPTRGNNTLIGITLTLLEFIN